MRLVSRRKIDGIRERFMESGAEIAIFVNSGSVQDVNIPYLTGFFGMLDGALVFGQKSGMKLVTSELDYERAVRQASVDEIVKIREGETAKDVIRRLLAGSKRIGVVKNRLMLGVCEKLKLPKSRLVDIGKIMRDARAVKEQKELEAVKKSADICNRGVRFLENSIGNGVKGSDLSAELERELRSRGSERTPFDTIVSSGPDSSIIHPYPASGDSEIGKGLGLVDFGAVYKGYVTDVTVPFIIGKPSKREDDIIETVLYAYDQILKKVKEGVNTKSINSVYENCLKTHGFKIKHTPGHGIGLETHDCPSLGSDVKLKERMTLALEPGVYVKGTGGCRLENDVVVKKKGCSILTKSKLIRI